MDYEDILYEVDGPMGVITLNRPDKLNAWSGRMGAEVPDAFERAGRDRAVRAIVITGAGRGFCSGADMTMLNSIAAAGGQDVTEDPRATAGNIEANYWQRFSFPLRTEKPLIAAVNGPAAGLGLILSLFCDMRFASDRARFATAFAKIGLVAEHGVSWLLPRAVGIGNALDLLYSARVIDADEAKQMGLVQRVFPHDELMARTKDYVAMLARDSSPVSMKVSKKLVWDAMFTDLARAIQAANAAMAPTLAADDFKEGLRAFAEKRAPNFQGLGD